MIRRVLRWVRSIRSTGADEEDSVWDAIPDWQYDGRHVELGGLTRDDQEKSVEAVQKQATEMEQELERP